MSIRIGDKIVAGMPEKALHGIGEIFTTTDTGVIAGAVEANGGSYNLADYNSGTDSVASKLAAGTLSYVSKTEFQTQVANTGACDSFGWDGTSDATFLVPKLKPWHVGKNAPVVGNGIAIGITNGTYDRVLGLTGTGASLVDTFSNPDLQGKPVGTIGSGSGPGWQTAQLFGISQNPSHSGIIADLSETTNLRVMVQLATGATDEALETCTSVLADVAGLKTDTAGMIDYVVEKQDPTSANGYTWYRKYKSGWVEQGGINNNNSLTYLIPMADTNYIMFLQPMNTAGFYAMKCENLTTTGATIGSAAPQWHNYSWQVSGKSAQ